MAQPLGTAPRRVSPGVWKTRKGATLSPAQSEIWERYFRTGRTDGKGHFTKTPSVVFQPPKPAVNPQKLEAYTPPQKPSFDTLVKAKHGDPAARQQVRLWGIHKQREAEGAVSAQEAADVGLFGAAAPAVRSAHTIVNPVAASVIESLSPTNWFPATGQALHGEGFNPLMIGLEAAGIFPFGRIFRGGKAAIEAAEVAAKAAGPEEKVLGAIPEAKATYREQAGLRSQERAKRVQSAGHAAELAGGGQAGVQAALGELKGKLPHVRFDALTHLTEPEVDHLINAVDAHPGLRFFENLNAKIALMHAAEGKALTPSEIKLIEQVFGPEAAQQAAKTTPLGTRVLRAGGEILNIPRSILSSFDVSGVLRQGLVASLHHPGVAAKNLGPMFHMLVSENRYQDVMASISRRANFDLYHPAGLSLTELGPLTAREEGFMSNLAEKIPILGRAVRGSGRSYTGFLNLMRADIFDTFLESAVAAGRPNTPELRRQIARQVNVWTGRGGLGSHGEKVAVPLNTVFFSPRLFASRLQTFATPFYKDLDPYVRKQAIAAASKLVASGTLVLLLAAAAGAKVKLDPRSSDWGKVRVGNTRFDIWGGHQQIARLLSQVGTGTIISSTTGKTLHVGNQFGDLDRPGITWRFIRGKFSPGTALIYDWFKGSDYQGKPFSWKKRTLESSIPLLLQDIRDVQRETGNPLFAAGAFIPGAFGIGVQSYAPKKPKAKGSDPFNSLFTGGGGAGEGGSDPFGSLFTGP